MGISLLRKIRTPQRRWTLRTPPHCKGIASQGIPQGRKRRQASARRHKGRQRQRHTWRQGRHTLPQHQRFRGRIPQHRGWACTVLQRQRIHRPELRDHHSEPLRQDYAYRHQRQHHRAGETLDYQESISPDLISFDDLASCRKYYIISLSRW